MSILSKNKRERSIRQQEESCSHFAESLNKAIWPSTNVDKFIKLLQETNYKCLNVRHGSRQDTCLHRFEIYIFPIDFLSVCITVIYIQLILTESLYYKTDLNC